MTEQQEFELVARAAGYPQGRSRSGNGMLMANDLYWNPKLDDGDSFRLMVRFEMREAGDSLWVMERTSMTAYEQDPCAATRLAIWNCALEIAKGME
jgi:hypothetical protein